MLRTLVIGGGIAGPVTAMALQKAGFQPTLYEAFDRTAEGVGAFMNIGANGLDALDCLDLADIVRKNGFDTPVMAFYGHTGRRLTGDIPTNRLSRNGTTIHTLQRSDLYITLRDEAVKRGISIEYGKRLVDATHEGDKVVAVFEDGQQVEGDLLVGADGLHSQVRKVIDPSAPGPRYLGVLNAFGYLRGYPTGEAPGAIRMFFGRKCFFMYTEDHASNIVWYANPPRPTEPGAADLRDPAWRDELLRLFEGDRMPAADIIRATTDMAPLFPNRDLPTVRRWHRGRMIIIGDAAHAVSPTVGSGASIAMEDGVVLAKCLRDAPTIAAGFAAYEAVRRDRVEAVVAQGKYNIEGNMRGPVGRTVRNFFLARAFRKPPGKVKDPTWMQKHHIDWDAKETRYTV